MNATETTAREDAEQLDDEELLDYAVSQIEYAQQFDGTYEVAILLAGLYRDGLITADGLTDLARSHLIDLYEDCEG